MALAIGRTAETMHHHEPSRGGHVGEIALHVPRRDALAQLVFGVELVAGHRQDVSLKVTARSRGAPRAATAKPLYSC
jgi:hypothetical protein